MVAQDVHDLTVRAETITSSQDKTKTDSNKRRNSKTIIKDYIDTKINSIVNTVMLQCSSSVTSDEYAQFKDITKTQSPSYYTLSYWVYADMMLSFGFDIKNVSYDTLMVHAIMYIFSFSIIAHMCTEIGRYAWMVVVWKWVFMVPVVLGIWTDTSLDAFLVDTSTDLNLGETDKDIGDTLSSILGILLVVVCISNSF